MWQRYRGVLKPGHFSATENRKLFQRLSALHASGTVEQYPLDTLTVDLPAVPGGLDAALEDFVVRRQLYDLALSAHGTLNQSRLLTHADLEALTGSCKPVAGGTDGVRSRIVGAGPRAPRRRHSTGLDFLDEPLGGGLSPGELVVVAAPPFGGKTHWLVKLASHYAAQGWRTLHLILEDIADDVIAYYEAAVRGMPRGARRRFERGIDLLDYADRGLTPAALEEVCRELLDGSGPACVVVDYADLLQASGGRGEDQERVRLRRAFTELRQLANRHGVLVLTATQADADAWHRRWPGMTNLAESKIGKASVADVILMLSQFPDEKATGEGRMVVAKARGRRLVRPRLRLHVDWDTYVVEGEWA